MAAPDALEVLAELNKKKDLKAVDHSKVDYIPFKKNLYTVPRALASLSANEVALRLPRQGRGSGKTLAYLLQLLRHIGDQPPLGPLESGPIGLILAPA